jgi:hypothetical protein
LTGTTALGIQEESNDCRCREEEGFHRSVRCLGENQQLGAAARRAFEEGRIRRCNNFIAASVDKKDRNTKARNRRNGGERVEWKANRTLDTSQDERDDRPRHAPSAHGGTHECSGMGHRGDADNRRDTRVTTGDE